MRDPLLNALLLRERFAPSPAFQAPSTVLVDNDIVCAQRLRDLQQALEEHDREQREARV